MKRILGPYLFEECVNQHNYLKILKSFFRFRFGISIKFWVRSSKKISKKKKLASVDVSFFNFKHTFFYETQSSNTKAKKCEIRNRFKKMSLIFVFRKYKFLKSFDFVFFRKIILLYISFYSKFDSKVTGENRF